ncbi:hypothetical protein KFL_006090040 [Klebsormidium nitens]|uniref:Uncharacterized protein n=1 Tax=Klebsormidium nitens TaxID=105231 RepID=A0A1Y1IPV9_KLENI|nr:hypothetical protein KFL_006090040 [Klebsormidium nitens]|eukprot:GAQ90178.1 hypothetical protein KFL_006090040 [Klebsormidium nitens]
MDRRCDCDFIPSMPVGSIRALEITPFPVVHAGEDLPSGWEEFISANDQPQSQSAFFNRLMKDLIKEKKLKLQKKKLEIQQQQEKIELERLQELKRKFQEAQFKKWAEHERQAEEEARRREAEEEAIRYAEEQSRKEAEEEQSETQNVQSGQTITFVLPSGTIALDSLRLYFDYKLDSTNFAPPNVESLFTNIQLQINGTAVVPGTQNLNLLNNIKLNWMANDTFKRRFTKNNALLKATDVRPAGTAAPAVGTANTSTTFCLTNFGEVLESIQPRVISTQVIGGSVERIRQGIKYNSPGRRSGAVIPYPPLLLPTLTINNHFTKKDRDEEIRVQALQI